MNARAVHPGWAGSVHLARLAPTESALLVLGHERPCRVEAVGLCSGRRTEGLA
jgi:hypothetical protein